MSKEFFKKLTRFKNINDKVNLNEEYMSDKLAWLLDPNGSHGLSIKFINLFIKALGSTATVAHTNKKSFSFRNASITREYALNINSNKPKYIDILFLDLDINDNIILAIENKYFTNNHHNQLEDYDKHINKYFEPFINRRNDGNKFDSIDIIYLTLEGKKPINTQVKTRNFSWIINENNDDSIYKILQDLNKKEIFSSAALISFMSDLENIQLIYKMKNDVKEEFYSFKDNIIEVFTNSIIETLNSFDVKKRGDFKRSQRLKYTIEHTCKKKIGKISLDLMSTLNKYQMTITTENTELSKFYIPLNINVNQINHLIHAACYNIYCEMVDSKGINVSKNYRYGVEFENLREVKNYSNIIRHIEYFLK